MTTIQQRIVPHLWYNKEAREAAEFYTSVFTGSRILSVTSIHDTPAGSVEIVSFELLGLEFMAISAGDMFKFNEAISFMVRCDSQEEIDYYWASLTSGGGAEIECGWLKDKFGLFWQVVPAVLDQMLLDPDEQKRARVTRSFLKMKKFDLAALHRAYEGR